MEFSVGYFALFRLFPILDGFVWVWLGSLPKNIQLMLEFLKVSVLVLHFSYYILMIFLMMLSAIWLSKLMILHSTLSVSLWTWIWSTRHGRLEQEIACWFRCWKNSVFFDWSKNSDTVHVEMDGSVLEEKLSLKMLEVSFSSQLHWGSCIVSIAKTVRKLELWFVLWIIFLQKFRFISINPVTLHGILLWCLGWCF